MGKFIKKKIKLYLKNIIEKMVLKMNERIV